MFVQGPAVKAGIAFIAGVVGIVLLALAINANDGLPMNLDFQTWPPSQDVTVSARFADANGLLSGSEVEVAGRQVGQVTGIGSQGNQALVTMRVRHDLAPIRSGTQASIRYSTLLAEKYVELRPSKSGAPLGDRAIPSARTVTPVDFDQFLSTLDPKTRQLVDTLIQQTAGGVAGRQATINDLLDQLHGLSFEGYTFLQTVDSHRADVAATIANLALVSTRLAQSQDQLAGFIGSLNDVTATLASRDQQLNQVIQELDPVMTDFNGTLAGNTKNFHDTLTTLDPLLTALNGTLGSTVPQLHQNLAAVISGYQTLIPFIGSAISQRDANGNYLRQYLVADKGCDSINATYDPSCAQGSPTAPPPSPPGSRAATPSGPSGPAPSGSPSAGGGGPSPSPSPSARPGPLPCWVKGVLGGGGC